MPAKQFPTRHPPMRRPYGAGRTLQHAPKQLRARFDDLTRPYPPPPTGWSDPWRSYYLPHPWSGPLTEWVTWWYLVKRKHMLPGRDFYYQMATPAPGLFINKPFTRNDFVIPCPNQFVRGPGALRALVLDPMSPFTHPFAWFDKQKRDTMAMEGILYIYLEQNTLLLSPAYVIEKALRGIDVSSRGGRLF